MGACGVPIGVHPLCVRQCRVAVSCANVCASQPVSVDLVEHLSLWRESSVEGLIEGKGGGGGEREGVRKISLASEREREREKATARAREREREF